MSISKKLIKVAAWLGLGLTTGLVLTVIGYQFEGFAEPDDRFSLVFMLTYMLSVGAAAGLLLIVSAALYLVRLDRAFYAVTKASLWYLGANLLPAIVIASNFNLPIISDFRREFSDTPIGWVILSIVGILVGGYIAYNILAWVGAFLGASFEQLADAQPKGRQLLFVEALNLGYTKPQTRAFIDELNAYGSRTNAGFVYTTMILYGIPFFAAMALLFGG